MSLLLALPEELLVTIAGFVHVGSIVNFGLACQSTLRCVRERLDVNREYQIQYKIKHDRLPLAVPNSPCLCLANSDAAWHVRALELWVRRAGWQDWETWNADFYWSNPNDGPN